MMNKKTFVVAKKAFFMGMLGLLLTVHTACGQSATSSNIYEEIKQYEWSDLYEHDDTSYEGAAEIFFILLPSRLFNGEFTHSLMVENEKDFFGPTLEKCFIPNYGGVYQDGIPIKNRESYEECYATTITVLKTLHKEYIEMGIIQKKEE